MDVARHPKACRRCCNALLLHIKANSGKMSYGSAGHGSLNHLTGELFKLKAGSPISHVRA
jgi:tripartite-type tricarboxylate transporter receptor subunit TctC